MDKWVSFGVGKAGHSSVQEEVQVEAERDQRCTAADFCEGGDVYLILLSKLGLILFYLS